MNKEIVEQAVRLLAQSQQCSDGYDVAVFALHCALSGVHREVLGQLVERGPVWDGDIISKSARNDLMDWGLATRVCVKGEQGFTGANYRGWAVHWGGMKPFPPMISDRDKARIQAAN